MEKKSRSGGSTYPTVKVPPETHKFIKGLREDLEGLFERIAKERGVRAIKGKEGNLPTMGDAVDCMISGWQTLDKAVQESILNSCAESAVEAWKLSKGG